MKKLLTIMSLTVALFLCGHFSAVSINAQQAMMTVYEHANQKGKWIVFRLGGSQNIRSYEAQHGQLGKLNDKISSITIWRAGVSVELCENEPNHRKGTGRCEKYSKVGRYNLRYNDVASYITIYWTKPTTR